MTMTPPRCKSSTSWTAASTVGYRATMTCPACSSTGIAATIAADRAYSSRVGPQGNGGGFVGVGAAVRVEVADGAGPGDPSGPQATASTVAAAAATAAPFTCPSLPVRSPPTPRSPASTSQPAGRGGSADG